MICITWYIKNNLHVHMGYIGNRFLPWNKQIIKNVVYFWKKKTIICGLNLLKPLPIKSKTGQKKTKTQTITKCWKANNIGPRSYKYQNFLYF